jgi:hypothetical protein
MAMAIAASASESACNLDSDATGRLRAATLCMQLAAQASLLCSLIVFSIHTQLKMFEKEKMIDRI